MSALAHVHDAEPPASLRGRRALVMLVVVVVAATAAGLALLWPPAAPVSPFAQGDLERIKGTVTALEQVSCSESPEQAPDGSALEGEPAPDDGRPEAECVGLAVRIDQGPERGDTFDTVVGAETPLRVGQGVVLYRGDDPVAAGEAIYQFADVQRAVPLVALAGIFLLAILALGRLRGLLAVVGLGASLLVLVKFLVPALLAGRPPVLTAVVGASAVMIVVLLLAHGPSIRTATAMVGTGAALLLTMLLATVFVERAGLSGLTSDDAAYVQATFGNIDLQGLLLAGIVIGALGILDDVTVTQVSAVYELRAADPAMSRGRLYAAALRVGRDHISSLVNTLLLAYAGASMPLLVIFATSGLGLADTLTDGVVAEEVVRTLVGSVGLISAVPITTALAAVMCPPAAPPLGAATDTSSAARAPEPAADTARHPREDGAVAGPTPFFDDASWPARARRSDPPDE
jgi:uncharacterized membrane protein